jgi:hypothetical protein
MKLRIVQIDSVFYIERKFAFWWFTVTQTESDTGFNLGFKTLNDAILYVEKHYPSKRTVRNVVWQQGGKE